MLLRELMAK
jgi:hypothetical protein